MKIDTVVGRSIDKALEFKKVLPVRTLLESRAELVQGFVADVAWAVGMSHVTTETVKDLMRDAGGMANVNLAVRSDKT